MKFNIGKLPTVTFLLSMLKHIENSELYGKYKANFAKLSGDCNVQDDRYIQGCYIQV